MKIFKTTLFLYFFLFFQQYYAQLLISPFTFGPMGGINSTSIQTNASFSSQSSGMGFLYGGFMRVRTGKIYLQPEVYYFTKNTVFTTQVNNSSVNTKVSIGGADINFLLGVRLWGLGKNANMRLFAGPSYSNITLRKYEVLGIDNAKELDDKSFNIQAGLGVDILRLTLDLRFEKGLSDFNTLSNIDMSTTVYSATIGFKILK